MRTEFWIALAVVALVACNDESADNARDAAPGDVFVEGSTDAVLAAADAGATDGAAATDASAEMPDADAPPVDMAIDMAVPDAAPRNPLEGIGAAMEIARGLGFTEGPVWREAEQDLLFTDIPGNTIHRWTPEGVSSFITPSGFANGLTLDQTGALVVAEHAGRIVRYVDDAAVVLAESFEGMPLNSPNDVIVARDGTVYFTDPPYGRQGGRAGPLGFIGLFRIDLGGTLHVEDRGPLNVRYNGLALSPDESTLYVSDTAGGTLLAWTVEPDGGLSNRREIAEGLPGADGMAVDPNGNIFVATADGVAVFGADHGLWGYIPIPQSPSNCALGDGALYVTARSGAYRVQLSE